MKPFEAKADYMYVYRYHNMIYTVIHTTNAYVCTHIYIQICVYICVCIYTDTYTYGPIHIFVCFLVMLCIKIEMN